MADELVSAVKELLTSSAKDLLNSICSGTLWNELKLLKGVEKDVQNLIEKFREITAVLDDAEKRSVTDDDVQTWVDQLKDVCYDIEDVLDEWRTKTVLQQQHQPPESASWLQNKVRSLWTLSHLPQFAWNRGIALKIKDINQGLDQVYQKNMFNFKLTTEAAAATEPERPKTTSFVDVSDIRGRDDVKKLLINRLLSESSQERHNLTITAIVGMGGIGKTTLAQLAFNDESVKKHFDKQIWVCVSQPFNIIQIARAILEGLGFRDGTLNLTEPESMLQEICKAIDNQKFLLVLDDVWNEESKKWDPLRNCLKNGAQGSKILMTTRSESVAAIMGDTKPIHLEKLSTEECWSIFSKIAFSGRSKEECKGLEEIGREMSKRCKGLPLAAKVLGGVMLLKRSGVEWQNVLKSDLWELKEANNDIYPVFMLSYYDLPSPMKRCFTYCAIFPEDHNFLSDYLIQHWMANGFLKGGEMEITGEAYIESLAMRSLFQDLERDDSGRIGGFKMHDLVRDFALRVSRNECGAIEVYKDKEEELMMKQEPAYAKLRHVWLICKGAHSSSDLSKYSIKGLRTLATSLEGPNAEKKVLGGLFRDLTSLRTLELYGSAIEELPVEIGKLMHLRYLGLEYNQRLKALPETVCDLFNLQTLKLSLCYEIERLPRGIGKLLNLRHLEFAATNIKKLPKGIGELTSLRRLSGDFLISGDDNDEEECFGIGDLEKLKCLEELNLLGLRNAELLDDVVVGVAKLKNLQFLRLNFKESWNAAAEAEEEGAKRELSIAEALLEKEAPPPDLKELRFFHYGGTKLPSWIASLSELKLLTLSYCPNLKQLPCDFFERPPPLLPKVLIWKCPTLAEHCRRRLSENSALASVFVPWGDVLLPRLGVRTKNQKSKKLRKFISI